MSTRERLKRRIRQIRKRHPVRYLGRWYRWARKRGEYEDNKRWAALISVVHRHRHYAWRKSYKAKKHGARWKVVHRLISRAHHWAQIENAYQKERRRLKRMRREGTLPSGDLVQFDGKTVAGWIVREVLIPARRSGLWGGVCYSGFRTPEYSESLCYAMCGRAACPGQCAGRASNHAKHVKPDGAVDVSDSQGLSVWEARNGYPTRHTLPYDLPHHSRTGQ